MKHAKQFVAFSQQVYEFNNKKNKNVRFHLSDDIWITLKSYFFCKKNVITYATLLRALFQICQCTQKFVNDKWITDLNPWRYFTLRCKVI